MFVNWSFISSLERLCELSINSQFEPVEPFFDFLKLDRLEKLSISNGNFNEEDQEMFFQAIRPLKNLKTLGFILRYVQNVVLSDRIETLLLWWIDIYGVSSPPNSHEAIDNLIRGPGVRYLFMRYPSIEGEGENTPQRQSYRMVDLRRYFPKLERVKAENVQESAAYKVITLDEPLSKHIW